MDQRSVGDGGILEGGLKRFEAPECVAVDVESSVASCVAFVYVFQVLGDKVFLFGIQSSTVSVNSGVLVNTWSSQPMQCR